MRIETRTVDEARGLVQITSTDERWYTIDGKFLPSVTWVCDSYPKGVGFYKWLAGNGWDESQALKESAGNRGNKVHNAISDILAGYQVRIDSKFKNANGIMEELDTEECVAILSFVNWFNAVKPETIAYDFTVVSEKHGYAGTLDYLCRINGEVYLIDFKTGQTIWPTYNLQCSAYAEGLKEDINMITNFDANKQPIKLAILQVGYRLNKNKYKFTEIENQFDLFMHSKAIWFNEHGNEKPKQIEMPIVISEGKIRE